MAMKAARSSWLFLCVVLGIGLSLGSTGCNPLGVFTFAAYLTGQDLEERIAFKFPQDARRVAVITYSPYSARQELGPVDRELNDRVSRRIADYFDSKRMRYKKEVILASKVQQFQNEHPDWVKWEKGEIGRALKADYLVYIDIQALSIYEEASHRTLYKGHAEMTVSVVRILPDAQETVFNGKFIVVDYPTKMRSVPTSDITLPRFREGFIDAMAKQVSWLFTPHETGDTFDRSDF